LPTKAAFRSGSQAYASLAAVPTAPGWYLPMQGYYYSGDASGSKSLTRGDSIALGLKSRTGLLLAQPTYAPETKVLGGQVSFGLGFGYVLFGVQFLTP
jgi:hypothetical protein